MGLRWNLPERMTAALEVDGDREALLMLSAGCALDSAIRNYPYCIRTVSVSHHMMTLTSLTVPA
jgi:hypothetical protein